MRNQHYNSHTSLCKLFLVLIITLTSFSCSKNYPEKILIFSKTEGYHHNSIAKGVATISKLAAENNVLVDTTTDATYFNEKQLSEYSAVIFLSTTGDVLDHFQQADFERYIQSGGGFVGIHAAADTEYHWPWYNELVGAYFLSHPEQQQATINILDKEHPATTMLPDQWQHFDEWYNYKSIAKGLNVLMSLDENSYKGGENGKYHPISWYRSFDGGRMFYTGLGHTDETFEDSLFKDHLWGGIKYAIGQNSRNLKTAKSQRVPEENRFVREVLAFNLNEPMELDYLPDNKVLFIERGGDLKLYDLEAEELLDGGHLNVKRIAEDGLLGLAVDPDYSENKWIYLFYSSTEEGNLQKLSRFSFTNDKLDTSTEKTLLTFQSTHDCCHSGGSLEFDGDGNLFLSTGDNTNPFASDGFSPSDEGPSRSVWDAQKSSANTNDLRGKILRIKPEKDGTYSIPSGNLFEDNDPKTRPEIYAMGLRNPFRISVDKKSGILYWGDVGPDAGSDGENRGPKGHDEINQAKNPGNWGWPYTRGNNKPYWDFDFEKKESIAPFNPNLLVNNSPNNTGIQNLPPAQESFIWYPYGPSPEFPWVGEGGRTAMAGPVFNLDEYSNPGFPNYFDGKLLVYEWMRDWIYLITMDENHDYEKAEPFLSKEEFHNPMDMVFGKDGNLYILEYGESWNTRNLDAQLNKITFVAGNRQPTALIGADKTVGAAPLTVQFSGESSEDLEGEPLKYKWKFGNGLGESNSMNPGFTFESAGNYEVTLIVTDAEGLESEDNIKVIVGNAPPEIEVEFDSKNKFYNINDPLSYSVNVLDQEDGSTKAGSIAAENVTVTLDFIPNIKEQKITEIGHQVEIVSNGKSLIDNSDCRACHAIDKKVNGPSYLEIAKKYNSDHKEYLMNKIKNGGSGVWGETPMAAHPQLNEEALSAIVDYILLLEEEKEKLPISGKLNFDQHKSNNFDGAYVLTATYNDNGNGAVSSLSSTAQFILKASKLEAEKADEMHPGNTIWQALGSKVVGNIKNGHYLKFNDVILNGLTSITFRGIYNDGYHYEGELEIRMERENGLLIGAAQVDVNELKEQSLRDTRISINPQVGNSDLYLIFKNEVNVERFITNAAYLVFNYKTRD
ncbi:ThuA domain-containing protein [Roseivirga sp.]|uniref:ThuA domain-containing protein n=1 Tax=Roseivirga sp. TaxID=1964215 RepID=UPI003B8D04C5